MAEFIQRHAGYHPDDIVILTDEPSDNPRTVPTRANMTAAMQWLVAGGGAGGGGGGF